MQSGGISWLNVLQRILQPAVHSWAPQPCFINLLYTNAHINIHPFHPLLVALSCIRDHTQRDTSTFLTGTPICDADWRVDSGVGRRAWLQLPHMTSPFAPRHSLHLPSLHNGQRAPQECVCVCVVSFRALFHLVHYIVCVFEVCVHHEPGLIRWQLSS